MTAVTRSVSQKATERWSVVSMPGAFRRTKTKLWGPSQMPNDPLEMQSADLAELDAVVGALSSFVQSVSTSVDILSNAPSCVLDPLSRFYNSGAPGCQAVSRFCNQLESFERRAKDGQTHMNSVLQMLQSMRDETCKVRAQFKQRDEAYQTHMHYSSKLDGMQEQISKVGTHQKIIDKLNRNQEKKRDSEQMFQKEMEDTTRAVNDVLSMKYVRVGDCISKFCKYYAAIFSGGDMIAREFSEAAQQLAGQQSAQQRVPYGQDMAQQFKDGVSGFASGMRDKFNSMQSTGSGAQGSDSTPPRSSSRRRAASQRSSPAVETRGTSHFSGSGGSGGFGGAPSNGSWGSGGYAPDWSTGNSAWSPTNSGPPMSWGQPPTSTYPMPQQQARGCGPQDPWGRPQAQAPQQAPYNRTPWS